MKEFDLGRMLGGWEHRLAALEEEFALLKWYIRRGLILVALFLAALLSNMAPAQIEGLLSTAKRVLSTE